MPIVKDKFAFPRTMRFSPPKIINHQISYEPKMSDFERVLQTAPKQPTRPGMGGSSPRFEYYSNRRKHGTIPSAQTHNSNTMATRNGGKSFLCQPNKSYSFGVSRHMMQKNFVDSILDTKALKTVNNPGPGEHELHYDWKLPSNTVKNKTGPQFSFSKSTMLHKDHFEKQLRKEGASPAPGQYGSRFDALTLQSVTASKRGASVRYSLIENPDMLNQTQTSIGFKSIQSAITNGATISFRNTHMEKVGKSLTSTIRTDRGNGFSRAHDRF